MSHGRSPNKLRMRGGGQDASRRRGDSGTYAPSYSRHPAGWFAPFHPATLLLWKRRRKRFSVDLGAEGVRPVHAPSFYSRAVGGRDLASIVKRTGHLRGWEPKRRLDSARILVTVGRKQLYCSSRKGPTFAPWRMLFQCFLLQCEADRALLSRPCRFVRQSFGKPAFLPNWDLNGLSNVCGRPAQEPRAVASMHRPMVSAVTARTSRVQCERR